MTTIILASSSPYRKAILAKLQLPFVTASPNTDERMRAAESASQMVERLAIEKARAVAAEYDQGLVIGCDQVAVLDQQVLGKPLTHDNAVKQLQACRGRSITFLTGLCVLNACSLKLQSSVEPFKVHFRQLTDRQIERYLRRETPYDCAGSFKSEGLGISLFQRLEGEDPNTLVGLPLIRLIEMLENEGIDVL